MHTHYRSGAGRGITCMKLPPKADQYLLNSSTCPFQRTHKNSVGPKVTARSTGEEERENVISWWSHCLIGHFTEADRRRRRPGDDHRAEGAVNWQFVDGYDQRMKEKRWGSHLLFSLSGMKRHWRGFRLRVAAKNDIYNLFKYEWIDCLFKFFHATPRPLRSILRHSSFQCMNWAFFEVLHTAQKNPKLHCGFYGINSFSAVVEAISFTFQVTPSSSQCTSCGDCVGGATEDPLSNPRPSKCFCLHRWSHHHHQQRHHHLLLQA